MKSEPNQSLLGLLDDTPIRDAPVSDLVSRGHHLKRRHRRLRLGGAATTAILVVGGTVFTSLALIGDQDASSPEENTIASDPADQNLNPPPASSETRLVGVGEVMVSVPATWGTGATRCFNPIAPTVYVETGATTYCVNAPGEEKQRVPSLAVINLGDGVGSSILSMLEAADSPVGMAVLDSGHGCLPETPLPGTPQGEDSCAIAFAVPDADVLFVATAWGDNAETTVSKIRNSLQPIPENNVAVPLVASRSPFTPQLGGEIVGGQNSLVRTIEAAGFEVETVDEYRPDLVNGSFLGVDPGFGTPVPRGTTVTLRVSTDTPG